MFTFFVKEGNEKVFEMKRVFAESCYSIEYVVIYIQTMTLMTGRQCLTDYYS